MDNLTFTLGDILTTLLIVAGIVALVALALFLFNLVKTLKQVNKILDDNEKDINRVVSDLPGITQNINLITTEANSLISTVGPEVQSIVGSAKHVVDNVETTALQVTDTVGLVSDSVADTALNLKHNVSSAQDYLVFVTEVADIVRAWVRK